MLASAMLAALAIGASSAHAQTERPHLVRGSLGLGKLLGDPQASEYGVGFGFGLGYEYRFHRFLGVGADYAGHLLPVRVDGVDGIGTVHGVGPTLDAHPLPDLALGDLRLDVGPDLAFTGGDARFGLHVGASFDFRIRDAIAVGPYVRYRHVFAPGGGQAVSDPKLLTFGAELTLALGHATAAPDEPAAPVDSDGDGIVDANDACVDAAEDRDGNADDDGCPESEDRDGDGIADASDACPAEPETANDFEDADGCPDIAPVAEAPIEPVVETPAPPEPEASTPVAPDELPAMGCAVGSAEVHDSHSHDLDALAETMRAHPTLRIIVVGHADPIGTVEYNEDLSRRRAQHVRSELIRRGIDASRIRTRWYGERRPVDPGTDDAARENNRRVQILIDSQ